MAKRKWVVDLDLGQNELQNAVIQNLASAPSNPKKGQHYFDTTTNTEYIWDGSAWVNAMSQGDYTFQNGVEETTGRKVQVKVGTSTNATVTADSSGLSVSVPDASTTTKGVIEIATDGECTTGTSEVLAVNPKQLATKVDKLSTGPSAGTYTKVTVNNQGQVTSGTTLSASDIPDISATYIAVTQKGVANGVATLDGDGKVPSSQLPSYVDDVIDSYIVSGATPLSAGWLSATSGGSALTPETGKIYVVLSDGQYKNKTYRWSGSTYVEISEAPGQATESTAGIAAIATQAEVTTGTNDTKIVTPLKLATYTSGMAKAFHANNTALTASGGVCTWTITNSLATKYVQVHVYEEATGDEVMTSVTATSGTITIKINSASNIAANTYFAVIVG